MNNQTLLIRPSTAADVPSITRIYARAVLGGTGTFELEAPDEAEMAAEIQQKIRDYYASHAASSSPSPLPGPAP